MKNTDSVRDFYEDAADGYSQMMDQEIALPVYDEVLSGLVDRIRTIEGAILDTSCGSGHMLAKLRDDYQVSNSLLGADLSPRMVELSQKKLGGDVTILEADMRVLDAVSAESCAAIISFYSLHHIVADELESCFSEWHRVLVAGGQLVIATWEGEGAIDYGYETNMCAQRFTFFQLEEALLASRFQVDAHRTQSVDDFEMDGLYISATCVR